MTQVLNINVVETPLGMKWTLTIMGKTTKGGYAATVWAALDDANTALAAIVEKMGTK